jgi:hypothetical protein
MEPDVLLSSSEQFATGPRHEPDESIECLYTLFIYLKYFMLLSSNLSHLYIYHSHCILSYGREYNSLIVKYLSVCPSSPTSERCVGRKVVEKIYFGESYIADFIKIQTLHIFYKIRNAPQTVKKEVHL